MAVRLQEIERAYFIRKLGQTVPPSMSLNEIKIRYWVSYVGGFPQGTPFNDMETAWIEKLITDATPDPGYDWADDWKEMVSSIGQTPTKYINQNKLIFYLNAP